MRMVVYVVVFLSMLYTCVNSVMCVRRCCTYLLGTNLPGHRSVKGLAAVLVNLAHYMLRERDGAPCETLR